MVLYTIESHTRDSKSIILKSLRRFFFNRLFPIHMQILIEYFNMCINLNINSPKTLFRLELFGK